MCPECKGCPDLLCHTRHTGWLPIEVKTRRTDYRAKKLEGLTPDQMKLHQAAPVHVVETLEGALQLFGIDVL